MKRFKFILFLVLIPAGLLFASNGNTGIVYLLEYNSNEEKELIQTLDQGEHKDLFEYFIHTSKVNPEANPKIKKLRKHLQEWNADRDSKGEEQLLQDIFYTVHRKFLKNYNLYSSFASIFDNGRYDCLTGTALYAYILDQLNFEYKILETRYHMALLITDGNNKYLIESTDPIDGLILDQAEVNSRIQEYLAESEGSDSYRFRFSINKQISIAELTGLLYYNQAVKKFNESDFFSSFNELQKALLFYRSPRIQEMMGVVLEASRFSQTLTNDERQQMLNAYLTSIAVASR